jgi:hypothetical protein
VMADMLKSIAVLGIVEALIFDLPAALGHGVEAAAASQSDSACTTASCTVSWESFKRTTHLLIDI